MSKVNRKIIIATGIIIIFAILWFLGGACTGLIEEGYCMAKGLTNAVKEIPIINMILPLHTWNSSMYWMYPIAGIVFMWYMIDWYNKYFKTEIAKKPIFLIGFLILGFMAIYFATYIYYWNIYALQGIAEVTFDYWAEVRESAFTQFIIAAGMTWILKWLISETENEEK